jgi:SAM-dependent methyltransferase
MADLYPGRTKYDCGRAETYARRNPKRNREEAAVFRSIVDSLPPGREVLDVPCGTGRIADILLDRGYRVTCADLSSAMLEHAATLRERGAISLRADLARLPLAPGTFDHAFCIRLFHHLPSPGVRRIMLGELGRVTRGNVVLTFFHPISFHNLERWIARLLAGRRSPRVCFTSGTLAREAATVGLRLERTVALGAYRRDLWFAVLGKA